MKSTILPALKASAVCALLVTSVNLPALAETRPNDQIQVLNLGDGLNDPEKVSAKAWSAIQLNAKTRAKITALNAELDKEGFERFKLIWLRLVNNEVQRVMFQGSKSTVYVIEMDKPKERCYVSVAGNGEAGACQTP